MLCLESTEGPGMFSGTTAPSAGSLEMAGRSLGEVEGWLCLWANQVGLKGLSRSWPPTLLTDQGYVHL